MIVSVKDLLKLFGIAIVCCCAVFVCTFMLNFYIDAKILEGVTEELKPLYDAQLTTAGFSSAVSGGFLGVVAVAMLVFYIKLFINSHSVHLGILKAMGYSDISLSLKFWVFGLSVFSGCAVGFGAGYAISPYIYENMSINGLPQVEISFHPSLLFGLVIAPTVIYGALACVFAYFSLKRPVTALMRGVSGKTKNYKIGSGGERSFLREMFFKSVSSKKLITFFVTLGAFCFSAMVQMAFSMREVNAGSFAYFILGIGLVLAAVIPLMSITSLINSNAENLTLMKAEGYSLKECVFAVLGGYIPFIYLGFALGTVYQYGLLSLMVNVIFSDVAEVLEYSFNVPLMFITLAAFTAYFGLLGLGYSYKISKIPLKSVIDE